MAVEIALKILRNIAAAMSAHAKLLIVEMVVPEGNEPHFSKMMDLGPEYHSLLADAGLRLDRIIPTQIHLSILEAVKA